MKALRTAVIGAGYLGRFHAEKYAALPESQLIAVVDTNAAALKALTLPESVLRVSDFQEILAQVEAVSIATPTPSHFAIAKACLEAGVHVLLEKPMTETLAEAEILVQLAKDKGLCLQIGHIERFNAALTAVRPYIQAPQFIESHRLAPFQPRGSEVSVLLDLMIHDIDIIQELVNSPITEIRATGAQVLSQDIDIANVRLQFTNGCVANVTASRVSQHKARKMRIFQKQSYLALDFQERKFSLYQKGDGEMYPGIPNIAVQEQQFQEKDALKAEIAAFLNAIRTQTPPLVPGEAGKRALETVLQISSLMNKHILGAGA
jgi:predicted dehydrogenase